MPPKRKRKALGGSTKAKKAKTEETKSEIPEKYVKQQADEFLESLQISKDKHPSSKSVLQLLIASLLFSARISENISKQSYYTLKNKYHDLDFQEISKASWNELCEVNWITRCKSKSIGVD